MMSYEWELSGRDEGYKYDSGGDDEEFDSYGSLDISMDNYSSFKHLPLRFTDQIQQLDKFKISSYGMAVSIFITMFGLLLIGNSMHHGVTDSAHVMGLIGGVFLLIVGAAASLACFIIKSQARDALSVYDPQKKVI